MTGERGRAMAEPVTPESPTPESATPEPVSAESRVGRNATLLCIAALTVMSGATIAASLPGLEAHFAGQPRVELLTRLVLTVPALFIALCAPLSGYLVDRLGRRRLLLGALALYAAAGSSGLWVETLPGLLAGRALLGLAVAVTMTANTALVGDYFTGAARNRYLGLQTSFMSLGGIVFLVGGGLLAEWDWRGPFAIYLAALLLIPAAFLALPEPARPAPLKGAAPAARPPRVILALFAAAFLLMAAFYLVPVQLPFHLVGLGIERPALTGAAIGGMTVTSALASFNFGRIQARIGPAWCFAAGFGAMAAGYALLSLATGLAGVIASLGVAGVGTGLVMPNVATTALTLAPPQMRGRVAGGVTASVFAGQFASPLLAGPFIAGHGYAATYLGAAVLLALISASAAAIGLRLRRAG